MARLHLEAENTKRRIVEVRRQAKATAAAAAEHAQQAMDAARREEARYASIREYEAMPFAIATVTAKLAAAHAQADARE